MNKKSNWENFITVTSKSYVSFSSIIIVTVTFRDIFVYVKKRKMICQKKKDSKAEFTELLAFAMTRNDHTCQAAACI